jgi:hypothetical protein
MDALLHEHELLLMPAAPVASLKLEPTIARPAHACLRYTLPVSLAGMPAVTIPFLLDGRPAGGMQLVAAREDDARLLAHRSTIGAARKIVDDLSSVVVSGNKQTHYKISEMRLSTSGSCLFENKDHRSALWRCLQPCLIHRLPRQPVPASSNKGLVPVRLQADWYPQPEQGGYFTESPRATTKKEGLDVTILPLGQYTSGLQVVASGGAEFGLGSSDQILEAVSNGLPLVAVGATMQHDPQAVMVHKDSPVHNFSRS